MTVAVEPRMRTPKRILMRHPAVATRAAARFEGSRLLRHPLIVGAAAMGAAVFLLATRARVPVLQHDDILMGLALLPLAGATFLTLTLAAQRGERDGTEEMYASLPSPRRVPLGGQLLSATWVAALGLTLEAMLLGYELLSGAIGLPSAVELLVGPAVVILCGAAGVCVGRWFHSPAAGPIALAALAGAQAYLAFGLGTVSSFGDSPPVRWLAPWVPIATIGDPARELVIRPIGWHLMYLIGLILVLGFAALLDRSVRFRTLCAIVLGVTLMAVSIPHQVRAPSNGERARLTALVEDPSRVQACTVVLSVRYCAYPSYGELASRWRGVISGVVASVPSADRPRDLQVRQVLEAYGSDLPPDVEEQLVNQAGIFSAPRGGDSITVGTVWPRGNAASKEEFALSLLAAAWTVGLPATRGSLQVEPAETDRIVGLAPSSQREAVRHLLDGKKWHGCSAAGQARAVIALWLAAQATPRTAAVLRAEVARAPFGLQRNPSNGSVSYGGPFQDFGDIPLFASSAEDIEWGSGDANYALQLLSRPRSAVLRILSGRWSQLTAPTTSTIELGKLFGLRPLPSLSRQLATAGVQATQAGQLKVLDTYSYWGLIPCP